MDRGEILKRLWELRGYFPLGSLADRALMDTIDGMESGSMEEFKGVIEGVANRSVIMDTTEEKQRNVAVKPLRQASFEIVTDGPFPHERLMSLVGKRVRVTILD
jgi:hypothetical protein